MKNLLSLLFLAALFSCTGNNAPSITKLWETDSIFQTPESVIFDKPRKRFYVSNIAGEPWADDSTGFVSIVDLKGNITQLKWIEGLHAPKGMGIWNDQLFIADNRRIVIASVHDGKIIKTINVTGAEQLNDITIDDKGNVYISDSKNPAIYVYANDSVSTWLTLKDIKTPNGLLAIKNKILLADMGDNALYEIEYENKTPKLMVKGVDLADGIVKTGKEQYVVSNWDGKLYLVHEGKVTEILNTTAQKINAADTWYIASDEMLLVPTFYHNTVAAYQVVLP